MENNHTEHFVIEIDTQDVCLRIEECCKRLNELTPEVKRIEDELSLLFRQRSLAYDLSKTEKDKQ